MKRRRTVFAVAGLLGIAVAALIVYHVVDEGVRLGSRKVGANDTSAGVDGESVGERFSTKANQETKLAREETGASNDQVDISPNVSDFRVVAWDGSSCERAVISVVAVTEGLVDHLLKTECPENWPVEKIPCGADGGFDLSRLQVGEYVIRAEMPGYAAHAAVIGEDGEWPDSLRLFLNRGKRIAGVVTDSMQNPLPDVEVYCYECFADLEQMGIVHQLNILLFNTKCYTDQRGEFEIHDVPYYESRSLEATCSGYVTNYRNVAGFDESTQRIVLKKMCVLEGHTYDLDQRPIGGAQVYYRYPQEKSSYGEVLTTNEEGYFRFETAPEGTVTLQAKHERHGNTAGHLRLAGGVVNKCDLILPDGIDLTIKVSDGSVGIENIIVTLKDVATGVLVENGRTDEGGSIRCSSVNPGNLYYVGIKDPTGRYTMIYEHRSFDAAGQVEYVLATRRDVKVRVRDEATKQLVKEFSACWVPYYYASGLQEKYAADRWMKETEVVTGDEGYVVAVGYNEVLDLTVLADGYKPASVLLRGWEEREVVDVDLILGEFIRGTVYDKKSGSTGFRVGPK